MAKIDLNTVGSGFFTNTLLNDNFTKIESQLNDDVLYRRNPEGEPNQLAQDIDANNFNFFNARDAIRNGEFVTLGQVVPIAGEFDPISVITVTETLTDGQTLVAGTGGTSDSALYITGTLADNGRLVNTVDYTFSAGNFTLTQSYPAGTLLTVLIFGTDGGDVLTGDIRVFSNVATLKAQTTLTLGDRVQTKGYTLDNDGGQANYIIVAPATGVADDGSYLALASGQQAELTSSKRVPLAVFGCSTANADNSAQAIAAFDSPFLIDGENVVYPITSPIVTTKTTTIDAINIAFSVPLEVTAPQLEFSSAEFLILDGVTVVSTLVGLSDFTVTEATNRSAFLYERPDDGEIRIRNVKVTNYKGQALRILNVAFCFSNNTRSINTGLGQRFYAIQSGFVNGVKVKDTRRIGVTFQSNTNAIDHEDLQLSNISVENIFPGLVDQPGDDHGIGIEIHNFIREGLLVNARSVNCHSMGLSLSSCDKVQVRNYFCKQVGYTSESVASPARRGFAGVEIVNCDSATVEGHIIDVYNKHSRFDKCHHSRINLICEQFDSDTNASFAFVRWQGETPGTLDSSTWGCTVEGIYRNNTATLLDLLDIGTFATFGEYRHKLQNITVFNTTINPSGKFRLRNIVIEDDGLFTTAGAGIGTLLDLAGAGDDMDIGDIEYIGLESAAKPDAFCRINSGSINAFIGRNLTMRNLDNILTAASGTLAEIQLHDCKLIEVAGLYTGTISSSVRVAGSDNDAEPRMAELPLVRHGNDTSGVAGQDGDILWKRNAVASVSPGWVYDGTSWIAMASLV